jgi:muramoyltetrapeptide carboxypeptidase
MTPATPCTRRALLAGGAALLGGCAAGPGPAPAPAPAARNGPPTAPNDAPPPPPLLRPPRLRPGDTVGLFASSSRLNQPAVDQARTQIEALGFRVRLGRHLRAVDGHYAGTVAQRVDDLHQLWADSDVRALWSVRGGAGSAALLPLLDYARMRRDPKAVVGFSDVTALLLALQQHAGLVGFHGPAATSGFTAYTAEALRAVLMPPGAQPEAGTVLRLSADHARRAATDPAYRARTLRGGVADGPLLGGNLSLLASLAGTPHLPAFDGALLFMEEIGEEPYRVDRMLTQLQQARGLQRCAALMAGVFRNCEARGDSPPMTLAQVIDRQFGAADVPAVYGWSFGHVSDQLTLPLGVRARIDTLAQTLTLLEPAVS